MLKSKCEIDHIGIKIIMTKMFFITVGLVFKRKLFSTSWITYV